MLIVSSDSDDRRLLDSSDESDASDDINDSDEIDASDNIDVGVELLLLVYWRHKGKMFSDRHKVEILKVCFLMPRGVVATVTCQTCTNAHFFSMGLKRSSTCSFVHLKMHKCTNAQFLAFDGTPSDALFGVCFLSTTKVVY